MALKGIFPTSSTGKEGYLQPFDDLRKEIDRVFSDFSSGIQWPAWTSLGKEGEIVPSIDVHETEKQIRISVELPGVDEKDVDVSVADDMLTISGEKKSEVEKKDGDYYRSERSFGSFSRSMSFPFSISEKSVDAQFRKGVLTVTIKKPAEAKPKTKKIAVKAA